MSEKSKENQEQKSWDLSELQTAETAVLFLRHPNSGEILQDDAGNPFTITLAGLDSASYREVLDQIRHDYQAKALDHSLQEEPTEEEVGDRATDILVGCTLDWYLIFKGEPLPFSQEKAREVYTTPGWHWIRNQVDDFIHNRSNYLGISKSDTDTDGEVTDE